MNTEVATATIRSNVATNLAAQRPVSLAPTTLAEAMEFSKLIANSSFVPQEYRGKPGDILVCLQMGAELGLSPLSALQSISVINGKPSASGATVPSPWSRPPGCSRTTRRTSPARATSGTATAG